MLLALAPLGYADEGGTEDSPAVPADNSLTVDLASTNKADWGDEDIFDLALAADLYLIVPTKANPTDGYDFANATSDFKGSVKAIADAVYGEGYWDEATNAPSTSFVRDKDYKPDYEKLLNDTIIPVAIGTFNGEGEFTPTEAGATISGSYSKESTSKKIDITGLTSGMYLLVPHGVSEDGSALDKADYVKTTKSGDTNATVTVAQTDNYDYLFAPQLISLPTKDPDENGVISTANPGEWQKSLTIKMKPQREDRYGDLQIIKTVTGAARADEGKFLFHVDAVKKDGNPAYSNVFELDFTGNGQKEITIEDKIPVGATVTVSEEIFGSFKQEGIVYQYVSGSATETPVIKVDEMLQVHITNIKEETPPPPGTVSIVNHFVYNGVDENGNEREWSHTTPADNSDQGGSNNEQ